MHAKLVALVHAYSDAHASPQNLLQGLDVAAEFRAHDSHHFLPRMVFAVLQTVLECRPEQFDAVYRYLLDVVVYSPQFLPNLIQMLSADTDATRRLLGNLNQLLCRLEPAQLVLYIGLAERIARVETLDPTQLLLRVLVCLTLALEDRMRASVNASVNEHRASEWLFGNALLQLYTVVPVHQAPQRLSVWSPVCNGLELMLDLFPDLEIRDRAHFLWLLESQ